MSTVDTATPQHPNATELWPMGDNKHLLYAISNYIQQIMKEHGTKLLSEELIKLSKIRTDMHSLLETISGHDFSIPPLHFTLPGIYKFYTSVQAETSSPSPSPPVPHTHKTTVDLITTTRSSSSSSSSSKSHRRCVSATNSTVHSQSMPATQEPYMEFERFLNELRTQQNASEHTPQYLVFLEDARKQFNIVYYGKYHIKSLDDVPMLRPTLYAMRHLPQSSASPLSDDALLAVSNSLTATPSATTTSNGNEPSLSLWSASYEMSKRYDAAQTQNIAIMGYFSTYLSVYKNGRSELKKSQMGYNEVFTSVPIDGRKVYIKTISNLYLGSDENGLLFLGNVRKHYQIWSVEPCANQTFAFKNAFGFYLCAYKSGKPRANSKKCSDWEKFKVFAVEDRVFTQCQVQYHQEQHSKIHDDEFVQMDLSTAVKRNRSQRKIRRDRKMSIDDMDIPDHVAIDNMNAFLLRLDAAKNRRGSSGHGKMKRNIHHHRAASARVPVRPPPKPETSVSGKIKPAPPPPRTRRNRNHELSQTCDISENDAIGAEQRQKRALLLDGIRRNVSDKSEHDIEGQMKSKQERSRSIGGVPAVGGVRGGGEDMLMAELRRKLMGKKKQMPIDDEKEMEEEEVERVEVVEEDEENVHGVDDEKEVNGNGEELEAVKGNKPALPPKSAKRVVRKIRSKYQRPLPAVPPKEKEEERDAEDEEVEREEVEQVVDVDVVQEEEEEEVLDVESEGGSMKMNMNVFQAQSMDVLQEEEIID